MGSREDVTLTFSKHPRIRGKLQRTILVSEYFYLDTYGMVFFTYSLSSEPENVVKLPLAPLHGLDYMQ